MYGFVDFDAIYDSTESFLDVAGNVPIARPDAFGGTRSRTMFSVRNSRIGFKLTTPIERGFRVTGLLEMDFLGNQPPAVSEAGFFTSPTFRIRHFAFRIENAHIEILVGQYWQLFGWQPYFHPSTVPIQGVPGQIFGRAPQVRLSRLFRSRDMNIEIAIAALRPPERDSALPDGQVGARLSFDWWKTLHTVGSTGTTSLDALSIGVSGVLRRFRVPAYAAAPTATRSKNGWGISVDAWIPVLSATLERRGNALGLTGAVVLGQGIGDLYTGLTNGITAPWPLTGPTGTALDYPGNIDPGLLEFDASGMPHTIRWRSYLFGFQYYPPLLSGHVWVSAHYSHMESSNIASYLDAASLARVYVRSYWLNANVFWDCLTSVRLGGSYSYYHQTYADGVNAHNHRIQVSTQYLF